MTDATRNARRKVLSLLFVMYAQYLERELELEVGDEIYHFKGKLEKVEGDIWKLLEHNAEEHQVEVKLLAKEFFKTALSVMNEELTKIFTERGLESLRNFVWADFNRNGLVISIYPGVIYTLLEKEAEKALSKLAPGELTKEEFQKFFDEILPEQSEELKKFIGALEKAENKLVEALRSLNIEKIAKDLKSSEASISFGL